MTKGRVSSNKAKIARRVIEVLEYFDEDHPEATVMDIVRRYDRPQSSTSELLSSLVDLGLLTKDPMARCYRPTARAALLGTLGQPAPVRDGRLMRLLDRLEAQTGLSVALFGMVGLNAQIVTWRTGSRASAGAIKGLCGGLQAPLTSSAAGWLLLATIAQPRRDGVIRRLNSEAPEHEKFNFPDMSAQVRACVESGSVRATIGFGSQAEVLAVLLPELGTESPLAVGLIYGAQDKVQPEALQASLAEAISQTLTAPEATPGNVERLPTAA